MAQVNLGSIFSSGGKTAFVGGASGLDTKSLIESLVAAKQVPKTKLTDGITNNTKIASAFSEFEQVLKDLRSSVDTLRNPPGFSNKANNLFEYRSAAITATSGTLAGDAYLSVTTSPGAAIGNRTVEVNQLARERTLVFSTSFTSRSDPAVAASGDATAGLLSAGVITLDSDANDPVNVTIAENDSLNNVVSKINAVKDQTGVEASIIQVSATDFRLMIKSTKTGDDNAFYDFNVATDPDGVFNELTVDPVASKTAQDAIVTIDGVAITRSSNVISDALDNVVLTLKQPTAGVELGLEIAADSSLAKAGIQKFVDAYNNFKVFTTKETLRNPDGSASEDARLVGNSSVNSIINKLDSEITRFVNGLGTNAAKSLQDIGITLTDFPGDQENPTIRNVMTLDDAKLGDFLSSKFEQLRDVFEFSFTADASNLTIFKRTNATTATSFKLEIDPVAKTAVARDTTTNAVLADFTYTESAGGATLAGETGTEFEGLQFLFAGSVAQTINVNMSQGIGDRLFNATDDLLTDGTGLIDIEVTNLVDESARSQKEITDLDAEIERYREAMLAKFSLLEQTIASVNQLLSALDAQDKTRYASGG